MTSMKVKKGDVIEIKCLTNPPEDVIRMMNCTMLLLGHPASDAKNWKFAQRTLGSPSTVLKNLETLDPKQCNPESVAMAKGILDAYDRDDIMRKSKAAAAFYDWNKETVAAAGGS